MVADNNKKKIQINMESLHLSCWSFKTIVVVFWRVSCKFYEKLFGFLLKSWTFFRYGHISNWFDQHWNLCYKSNLPNGIQEVSEWIFEEQNGCSGTKPVHLDWRTGEWIAVTVVCCSTTRKDGYYRTIILDRKNLQLMFCIRLTIVIQYW